MLEVDGVQLSQSMTIARFLANKFNLAGSNPLEKAQADMVVDCVTDFFNGMRKFSNHIITFHPSIKLSIILAYYILVFALQRV